MISHLETNHIHTCRKLETLEVDTNRLDGTIPSQLGQLSIEKFYAHRNRLEGPVPEGIWSNTLLQALRLDENSLTGTISGFIGSLVEMTELNLDENEFDGTLPLLLGRLSNLISITIAGNQLSGTIRDTFTNFMDLETIDFSDNQFTGAIPSRLFNLPNLKTVAFHDNDLDGRIPENIGSATALEILSLSGNSLTGPVPSINPGELVNLQEFLVHENQLTGSMAQSICELRVTGFGVLDTLWADCSSGADPRILCDTPECCTTCFPIVFEPAADSNFEITTDTAGAAGQLRGGT